MPQVRLQRFLAQAGVDSRRKAERLIASGQVKVNGRVVTELGTKVDPDRDRVMVGGRLRSVEPHVYLLLHKPRGYVTTVSDPEGRPTVMDLVPPISARVFPVGRLDWSTEGLLLLTNDGELAHALMHPSHGVAKTYHVKLKGLVPADKVAALGRGVRLEDGTRTRAVRASVLGTTGKHTWVELALEQGMNRQVHRMAEALGLRVLKLIRVRYANLSLEGLEPGDVRPLERRELARLRSAAGLKKGEGDGRRG